MANALSGSVRNPQFQAPVWAPESTRTPLEGSPQAEASTRQTSLVGLAYSGLSYLSFHASFGYFIFFINDLLVPRGVADGPQLSWGAALAVNIGLIVLWGLQHSVMARKSFKERWTRVVPPSLERSTYVLASSVALTMFMAGWAPIAGTVWQVESEVVRILMGGIAVLSWLFLVVASFEIDHFELFGLKQAYFAFKGKEMPAYRFQSKFIYRIVRHPIQTGILFGMWVAPTMSASRFLCAGLMTVYMLVGLYFEERDLVRQFGQRYVEYKREVAKLIPWGKGRRGAAGE